MDNSKTSLSTVSEKNLCQSVNIEFKINFNRQLTNFFLTLTKTKFEDSFETFEEPSCLGSFFGNW